MRKYLGVFPRQQRGRAIRFNLFSAFCQKKDFHCYP